MPGRRESTERARAVPAQRSRGAASSFGGPPLDDVMCGRWRLRAAATRPAPDAWGRRELRMRGGGDDDGGQDEKRRGGPCVTRVEVQRGSLSTRWTAGTPLEKRVGGPETARPRATSRLRGSA